MTFPTDWARKCALTINSAQIVGSGTHNNFPVLLTQANLPSDMLDKDGAAPARMGGGDIRFTSDALGSTKLPCHVVEFITANDPATARAMIYVGLNLPTGSSTTIYVWYRTATEIDQPKYDANPDADGFKGSDYVWANYDIVLPLGGFGGLRNLKQVNAAKNAGRYGNFSPRAYTVATRATGNAYISFPSLAKVGERLYCCAREATTHAVSLSGVVGVRYSDDMGRTWVSDTGLGVSDGAADLRESRLFVQSTGTLWLFYTKTNSADTSRIVAYRKASAPYSAWGAETILTSQTKANGGSKPIQLASGRIVVPCYEIDGSGNTAPFVRWTDDAGASWTTDYLTADGAAPGAFATYNETSIAEDPATPGNLVAIMRRNGFQNLYRQTSTDSGQTWSSAAVVTALAIDSGSFPDMPELLYARDGDLLCAYAKDRNAPEYRVVRSTDHGVTWATEYGAIWANEFLATVTPGGYTFGSGGYCSMVEVTKGVFAVVYYYDNGGGALGTVWCTHVTKVEDGPMNYWTDTTWATSARVGDGIELSDADVSIGSGSLSYWNNVHNAGAFTISGWAKFNQVADEAHCFVGSTTSSQDRGFFFAYDNRTAAGSLDALRLYKADGAGVAVQNQSTAITGDTSPHRFAVFCSALGVPTFIRDTTTYAGSTALTATAGNAELATRIGGASIQPSGFDNDLATFRLDGWMGMWTFSALNLGADYEKTRYNAENAPATFLTAGTPTSTDVTAPTLTGSITVSSLTTTSYTLTCPAATDDVAVTGYQYRLDGGSWVTIAGGARTVGITARTSGATDAVEMRAFDAAPNYSTALSTSVTLSGGSDTTAPTLVGSITVGTVTSASIAITWPTGADNVAVSSYEVHRGAGWVDTGSTSTGYTFTGLTAGTAYTLQVRAKDAAGNVSTPALSVSQSTASEAPAPVSQGSRRLTLAEMLRGVT